ncbi:MAG: polyprenyl synthetase family protein [Prevotellaceae bacterium]|jgi:geranylgeranyl diphosphate synthase type II|nr:polyprenyl synthetase family protein [Prevotellaceae bacterium]
MNTFEDILAVLEAEFEQISWQREPQGLYAPVDYVLSLGGKRLRPALTLMGCNLFSDNILPAIKPAIGIEIFHNFTLLHDDIMDKATLRRGKPTVNVKWNANTAILSGDLMQIEAYRYISESPEAALKQILDIFSQTAAEVCYGQQYDMDFETLTDVDESDYLEMIRLKTAVILGCALKIGAIIGGAQGIDCQRLYEFGINLGLAFQIKDDWLDVWGDERTFGKKLGGDILCNKKTYLLINALQRAKHDDAAELNALLTNVSMAHDLKIKRVTEIFNRLKIKELAEEKINFFYEKSLHNIASVNVSDERKTNLQILAEKLLQRSK